MNAVRDHLEDFGPDTDVVLVAFATDSNLAPYLVRHGLPFPVLSDPERTAYSAFGIGRGKVRRVWGWRMVRRYIEIYREQGFEMPTKATEDTLQLGGNFIVDPKGILIYGYWGEGPDDRPPVQELIDAVDVARNQASPS